MPRDGSMILSDVREPMLPIVCEPCGRRGRYNVDKLMAEHGDAKLTDLLATLADCAKARSASIQRLFATEPLGGLRPSAPRWQRPAPSAA